MFEENKDLVTDVTENVEEQTTEEIVEGGTKEETVPQKTYTDAEVDEIVSKRLARSEKKLKREFEKELSNYKEAESVLNAGLGTSNIKEATNNLREFYTQKGVEIPKYEPTYSDNDMKVLADAEANSIIDLGFEEVVEEVERLAEKGVANMTPREKLVFTQLAEYRKTEGDKKELAKIGVKDDVLNSDDFKEFAKDFKTDVPITKIYEKYAKIQPKPVVETMGSMKNTTNTDSGVKDFYTRDEALKFTKKDFDNNPTLFKAVENSMSKW